MTKVTAEQVAAAVKAAGITQVEHHDCSMCGYMTRYVVAGGELYFDAGCDCVSRRTPLHPTSWADAAHWINMQTNEGVREQLKRSFGILPPKGKATESAA